jgi:hypothetical protein
VSTKAATEVATERCGHTDSTVAGSDRIIIGEFVGRSGTGAGEAEAVCAPLAPELAAGVSTLADASRKTGSGQM